MTATLGPPVLRSETIAPPPAPARRPGRVPKVLAAILWVVALVAALAAVAGVFTDEVRREAGAPLVPIPPNLGYAVCVAVLAAATVRRKRIAWWLLLGYFAVAVVVSTVLLGMPASRVDDEDKLVAAVHGGVAVLAVLVLTVVRRDFVARVRRGAQGPAVAVFVVLMGLFVGLGYALVTAYPGTLGGTAERLAYAAEKVFGGAVVTDLDRDGRAPGWVDLVLGLLGGVALLAALWTLRRSQRAAAVLPPDDEQRIRTLLTRYGDRDSLGYLATRRDRVAAFSPTGRAAVSYRVVHGIGLATGDPIGDPTAWGPAVEAWLEQARAYSWTPAVAGASEDGAVAYARAGLAATQAGDEAVLHSGEFTLDGRTMRPVRQAVNRLERAGYTARVRRHADVPDEEMRAASLHNGDGRCVLAEAYDGDGERAALLSLAPWGPHGLYLDVVRRAPGADDGVVDFLVAALMREAPRLGVDRVSLGVADDTNAIYRASARYQPQWIPRYVCAADRRDLPRVWRAAAMPAPAAPAFGPAALDEEGPAPEPADQSPARMAKRDRLRNSGVDPYPAGFHRTDNTVAVAIRHEGLGPDARTGDMVAVAGRIVQLRDHGGVCFATIRDWTGDLQVLVDDDIDAWRSTVDVGDHVGVRGEVVTSRRGELSVRAESWQLTAKCLRPLPDRRRGPAAPDIRPRDRYLDLVTSPEARDLLRGRSAAVHSLRESLLDRGYLEVETPVLHRFPGTGARPLTTRLGAYDLRLYLRVTPGPYLKRLVVAGVERVFELGRAFRNEGVDVRHNPEFTLLEAYQAYADHRTMRGLAQALVQRAALAAYGSTVAYQPGANGTLIEHDLSMQWPAVPFYHALSDGVGEYLSADTELHTLRRMCDANGVLHDPRWGRGALLAEMYGRLVEARTTTPTFYTDFPIELAPVARAHRTDPRLAEHWDLVAFGTGIGTGRSEVTDPVEQRRRFAGAAGDPEGAEPDVDFVRALEYAMPPTGGLALGADRVVALLTGRPIRETMPFPLVRGARTRQY
ncbi:amino acid--tRNA ligase-related protein [Phytohabitans rumicis]|uniref:Lysine--tRNA ligase n=1 Tax=Phytohabitans rumicis TaxID=1076125 RepID=A0A6V8L499_9ACTN|nr:amino acid--tRNA ligase-related protein [Phytohabitans rumicis]GFJ89469.1 lysine--tRNA ligase [Phytohabitans rumicis]